ncbi:MAG: RNA polymerase factor sigma-54 [Rhodobacteraceae bacterium]|nr:RNA polymerase factor sigma-54 [Paracoccaceae bacterium]MCF8513402.1 RNA polymerase factor sigma-54 [Paracoccaceae bacterium]MCF8517698.1 RNA polymerase factor sigma-54 [Paracoccaceae bacterium]
MQLFNSQTLGHRQSMVVNAQLQQAIHLLALGNADLTSFIEKQSEENPFVELAPLPRAVADRVPSSSSVRASGGDDWDRIGALAEDPGPSLYAHVTAAISRLDLSADELAAASVFLDALEPSGWLGQPIASIALRAGLSEDAALVLLSKLQSIEPAGLFARTLAECLRLQAAERGILTARFGAILDNLKLLAQADLKGLARACGCKLDDLKTDLRALRALNPKPGAMFETYIMPQRPPDLIVNQAEDGWHVDLNRSTLPRVLVRAAEAQAVAERCAETTSAYVGERLSVARWLARAVEHRNQTILKVGAEVVRRQTAFLEGGAAHLRPMILREVADAIGVHESTVSRVTSGMLVATPQGTFPLKSFFSAALSGSAGEGPGSAAAVRHRIKQLVQAEAADDPLSDEAIAKIVSTEGVVLARRTVAKYRDMLSIPSSSERRRRAVVNGQI